MRIEFTGHVLQKIKERNIPLSKIVETVNHPDFSRATYNNREERYKKFGKNHMMVIVRQEGSVRVVITAHWVVKLPKK